MSKVFRGLIFLVEELCRLCFWFLILHPFTVLVIFAVPSSFWVPLFPSLLTLGLAM